MDKTRVDHVLSIARKMQAIQKIKRPTIGILYVVRDREQIAIPCRYKAQILGVLEEYEKELTDMLRKTVNVEVQGEEKNEI